MHRSLPALLVVAVGVGVYGGSFHAPLIYDDHTSIAANPSIRSLWPLSLPLSPPANTAVASRPLVNLTFAVNYALGGTAVEGYHLLNLALHVMSSLLLLGIVRQSLQHCEAEHIKHAALVLATAVALFWTAHPLQNEAVVYLSQRTELLMGFFYLSTLYCCIRGWYSEARKCSWFAAAVCACALGMASKEVMVTAPLIMLLYDRTFVSSTWRTVFRRHWALHVPLALTWLVLLLLADPDARNASVGYRFGISAWDYLRTQALVILHYLKLSFRPWPLAIAYGFHIETDPLIWLPKGLLVLSLLGWTLIAIHRHLWVGFLGAWFFLILAPTSSVLPIATQIIAERRVYLPLAAVVVIAVIAGYELLRRTFAAAKHQRVAGMTLIALVTGLLATGTAQRVKDYRTEQRIWQAAVDDIPNNDLAHTALGFVHLYAGRPQEALEHARAALSIRDDNYSAMKLAGQALAELGEHRGAVEQLRTAILRRGKPDPPVSHLLAMSHAKLAFQRLQSGRGREAIDHYEEALAIEDDLVLALNGLARILAAYPEPALRDGARALQLASRACDLTKHANPGALDTLAGAHAETGDFERAVELQQQVLELAREAGQESMLPRIRARIEFYRKRRPYRLEFKARLTDEK